MATHILERAEHFVTAFWAAIGAGVAGAVLWFVRTVITNQKVVAALQAEVAARDERRRVEREADHALRNVERGADQALLQQIAERVTRIEGHVMALHTTERNDA